jgi:3'-phosphoadenosine 5'-phosphosulfate sulfotransferase (PAPS reductase)/FAD synthetase
MPAPIDFSRLQAHAPGKVALMFSGGKDSRALIELLRPYLDGITVYHCDTGDMFPETREYVAKVAETIPHFRRIETNAPAWIAKYAIPSDLAPLDRSPFVSALTGRGRPVVSSVECCSSNQWEPMADQLAADGITLEIHGQRDSDWGPQAPRDAPLRGGIEEWRPIRTWTADDVFAYLKSCGVELARFSGEGTPPGPDCATCPAGWSLGRAAYLRKYHPDRAAKYHAHLRAHAAAIEPHLSNLRGELLDLDKP